ncbi:MAG: CRISPR-associated protein Cas5 [Chlorobi bacterium]|nr:CRISPR-associated protein Cas5 [Chlorobiota bacterium]
MSTLLLRLAGPMQSWGVQSRFEIRDTMMEPSKSGVIGLVCAALGRDRKEPIDDLAALRMGVRIDREGEMRRDYHTACDVAIASGGTPKACQPSVRHYLADARFLVGLESDDRALLERIADAFLDPCWPIFLGRKSFVPGEPVVRFDTRHDAEHGPLRDEPMWDLFQAYDWPAGRRGSASSKELRCMMEAGISTAMDSVLRITRPDQPISFEPRRYGLREIDVFYVHRIAEEVVNVSE